jgi:hypothetical protein
MINFDAVKREIMDLQNAIQQFQHGLHGIVKMSQISGVENQHC